MAIEFIKLTGMDKDIYVNLTIIIYFCDKDVGGSFIVLQGDDNYLSVKESPEQILAKMKEIQEE